MLGCLRDTTPTSVAAPCIAACSADARYASRLGAIAFLVKDTVFASLGGPNPNLAILKLTREDQARAIAKAPSLFLPQSGRAGAGTDLRAPEPGER